MEGSLGFGAPMNPYSYVVTGLCITFKVPGLRRYLHIIASFDVYLAPHMAGYVFLSVCLALYIATDYCQVVMHLNMWFTFYKTHQGFNQEVSNSVILAWLKQLKFAKGLGPLAYVHSIY